MHTSKTALLIGALALKATAAPFITINSASLQPRGADIFKLHSVAIYGVTSDFHMVAYTEPTNIKPGHQKIIHAPYYGIGLRLSGHAEWGTDGQWVNQALFEFGYSEYAGQTGTAYDVSIMEGSEGDIGLGAYPIPNGRGSETCRSQSCWPWYCPLDQGWTNPNQIDDGSTADTVCYHGKTDFKIVWCP
ncbi:uncharacterized protein LTR77_002935 [Saxophila tyrrhenica]|uniref:Uncharacterized protein n=1 Tax=Saxophila tyrrhenica TaxID=1690608 RepID=A0AAV9PKF2_9PEZI|nr:hypothetical protein LTR77_002935 [Saxophila tyrrhenica]